jgi:hypothetical protein
LVQAVDTGLENFGGGAHVLGHPEQELGIENVLETRRVSWHVRMQMFKHLLSKHDILMYEPTTMPCQ